MKCVIGCMYIIILFDKGGTAVQEKRFLALNKSYEIAPRADTKMSGQPNFLAWTKAFEVDYLT